jgi:hypothetical protein
MRIVSAHKVLAAVIGGLVLVALCSGTAMAVTNHVNANNLAAQRAAATQQARKRAAAHRQQHMEWLIQQAQHKAQQAAQQARQARQAAQRAANRPAPPVVVVPAAPAQPSGLTDCGSGTEGEEVYAGSDTSCAFALNVESDYWNTPGMNDSFTSYSPVTGQDYFMTAVDNGTTVTATNSTGALVEFSDGG